ncbi:hypothetical protein GCM10010435_42840 [Winogradskya consettensis]|uniref:Uncharacterized protein n=1 Tax=Winogradskya consettensis TaxID=113560 RepID=A0A919SUX1_9ACTN|nr:hypothetical protein [Actinoplanes consettensis]GIM77946.1 hypothetical protein Aco04nite_57930 [Actinoplanes consettensis]
MAADREISSSPFAGELFLTLATEGRLVVDTARANEVIEGLERTLSLARARLRVLKIWQHVPAQRVDDLPRELADDVVDAVFADQLAPGRLEQAVEELPKYIEALRQARRKVAPGDIA